LSTIADPSVPLLTADDQVFQGIEARDPGVSHSDAEIEALELLFRKGLASTVGISQFLNGQEFLLSQLRKSVSTP
jgi:hypothetical protein